MKEKGKILVGRLLLKSYVWFQR